MVHEEEEPIPQASKKSMSQIPFEMTQKNKMYILYSTCPMRL